ncbi:MAG: hypothetical protein ACKPER_18500 [Dolichospermum sp.]
MELQRDPIPPCQNPQFRQIVATQSAVLAMKCEVKNPQAKE